MIDGVTSRTGTPRPLDADLLALNGPVELGEIRHLQRIVAFLDGLGLTSAPQLARGVIYQGANLLAAGDTVAIANDQPAGWVPLTFSNCEGLELPPGSYLYGLQTGQSADAIRAIIADGQTPAAGFYAGEPFVAGAPPSIGAPSSRPDGPLAMYLETLEPLSVPVAVLDDDYLAALPFPLTQRLFTQTAPLSGTGQVATAGWYGSQFDEIQGANAIVRSDGPLAGLVGERVQVRMLTPNRPVSVVVYVHDMAEFPDEIAEEDLVLSRRAFLQLANLGDDDIQVQVTVMA